MNINLIELHDVNCLWKCIRCTSNYVVMFATHFLSTFWKLDPFKAKYLQWYSPSMLWIWM